MQWPAPQELLAQRVPLSVRLGWAAFDLEGLFGGSSRGEQLFVYSCLKDGPSLLEKVMVNGACSFGRGHEGQ